MRKSESQSKAYEDTGNRTPAEVFVALYEDYMPKVFRYMSYRLNDASVVEDLTSDRAFPSESTSINPHVYVRIDEPAGKHIHVAFDREIKEVVAVQLMPGR